MRAVTTQSTNDQPEVLLNCLLFSTLSCDVIPFLSFFLPVGSQVERWPAPGSGGQGGPAHQQREHHTGIDLLPELFLAGRCSIMHAQGHTHAGRQAGRSTKAHCFLWPPFPCTAEVEKALNDYPSAMKASRCPPSYTRGSSCRRHTHACLRACTHPRKHTAFLASLLYHFWLLSTLKCY